MPTFSKWFLSFIFPYKNIVFISLLHHTCHIPCLSHSPWFDQHILARLKKSWQFEGRKTYLPKSALFKHLACPWITTRVSITSVYHILTVLAMIPRRTATHVLTFRQRFTLATIGTRKRKTGIALRHDLVTDTTLKKTQTLLHSNNQRN